jgi:hypothetical protein
MVSALWKDHKPRPATQILAQADDFHGPGSATVLVVVVGASPTTSFQSSTIPPEAFKCRATIGEDLGATVPEDVPQNAFSLRKIAKKFKLGASLLNKMKISSFQM